MKKFLKSIIWVVTLRIKNDNSLGVYFQGKIGQRSDFLKEEGRVWKRRETLKILRTYAKTLKIENKTWNHKNKCKIDS